MTHSATFGQWQFYGILAIVILLLSQTLLQANDAGMREFASACNTLNQEMEKFKQLIHVIEVNEDPDAEMLKIVWNKLDGIRQILEAFEPVRGVVDAPGITIVAYRQTIHELTKAPDNTELLLIYNDYLKIYTFLDDIRRSLARFANKKYAIGTDRHPDTLKAEVNQLRGKVIDELIPTVKQEFDLFEKWKECRIAELYLNKLSTEVYKGIPIPSNMHTQMVVVANNAAPLISAKFAEHQKRLKEITSEPCNVMDTLLKWDKARGSKERMQWMKELLENVLSLNKKVTLFSDRNMSNTLYQLAYGDRAKKYRQNKTNILKSLRKGPDAKQAHGDEMEGYGLCLKVSRIVDVENRQFYQMLTREFAAQLLDDPVPPPVIVPFAMQVGLFNDPQYKVHRDFMSLLNAAKILVNGVVLPNIMHIFGTGAQTPLHQHRQQPESRAQRVHKLALVNKIVGPKLQRLANWEQRYRDKSHMMDLAYPNAEHLFSIYGYAQDAFDTFQWLDKQFDEHDNIEPTEEEYKLAVDALATQINDGVKRQRAEFIGEHIFQEWDKKKKGESAEPAAAKGTPLTAIDEEDELMADGMNANPANSHKRTQKAMEIDGEEENQAGSSHVAGDKMKKI